MLYDEPVTTRPLLAAALLLIASGAPASAPAREAVTSPAAAPPAASADAGAWVELHRLRIVNHQDGAIQISTDGGRTWSLLGRVTIAAMTAAEGYLASNYADPGTVSAVAVHGLRIRVGGSGDKLHAPLLLSVNPREYAGAVNKGFGGHVAGSAGIFTDIPAGASIFRNLAPLVGNQVYLENGGGPLVPLPQTFRPQGQGEVLVIVVRRPANSLVEVTFENRRGGKVEARFADGTRREITTVVKPVLGIGRFDGTAYTGVGRLNTAHTGVLTVSTAPVDADRPEGEGRERRGGFQISPAWHNARTEEAGAAMVMTVGAPGQRKRDLEGQPPLFRDMVSLVSDNRGSPSNSAIVDVSIDGGSWEPMPALVGVDLDAFTGPGLTQAWRAANQRRTAKQGVTAFRLRLPVLTAERSKRLARDANAACTEASRALARAGKLPIVRGRLTINANPTDAENVAYVRILVEGAPRGLTNTAPFTLTWDTTRVPDGDYLVEAEALDSAGGLITVTRRRVFVDNSGGGSSASAAGDPAGRRR